MNLTGQNGFEGVIPTDTGRPAYHPSVLLKISIYGYLKLIQSSRRLERDAGHLHCCRSFSGEGRV
jgi:transposase